MARKVHEQMLTASLLLHRKSLKLYRREGLCFIGRRPDPDRTAHPPASVAPLVVMKAGSGWSFLLTSVLAGAIIIVPVALLANHAVKQRRYPAF
ncbi:HPP family protein [Paenibacillus sp. FSL M8-0142]|uniref:HPP family protein n=1 Tax=Paenibacillus TaxID=44249 RepID=UPI00315AC9C6